MRREAWISRVCAIADQMKGEMGATELDAYLTDYMLKVMWLHKATAKSYLEIVKTRVRYEEPRQQALLVPD